MKSVLIPLKGVNLEDIPSEFHRSLFDCLPINGGNVVTIDEGSQFGDWLKVQGFEFSHGWGWLVIWR